MKVLFVANYARGMNDKEVLPLSVYALAGLVREMGYEVSVYDPILYPEPGIESEAFFANAAKCDLIGFSVNSFGWGYARDKIKGLKERGFVGKIITGGVHPTHNYQQVLQGAPVDYVVRGECEKSLPLLLGALEKNNEQTIKNTPGIAYWADGKITVNPDAPLLDFTKDLPPLPAYDLVPADIYHGFTFESSRGCFGNCTFCSIIYKKCWRCYTARDTVARLSNAYAVMKGKTTGDRVYFSDDCFITEKKWVMEVLHGMKATGLDKIAFAVESRARSLFDCELLSLLTDFPNIFIQVGIEAGYDSSLKKIRKGITVDDAFLCAKLLYEFGLSNAVMFSFIIGFPWETESDCLKTLETVAVLKDQYGVTTNCSWWIPVPSKIWDDYMKNKVEDNYFEDPLWIMDEELFYKTHPLLDSSSVYRISSYTNIYNDLGLSLRL